MTEVIEDPHDRWEHRWATGKTGWDQGGQHSTMVEFLDSEKGSQLVPSRGIALVPACGRGYDVQMFADRGLDAIGIDISETGVEEARKYLDSAPSTRGTKSAICADFFKWTESPESPRAELILDYTFLCAIHPSTRQTWSESLKRIASASCVLLTLMWPLDPGPDAAPGPPFPLSLSIYHDLLDKDWELVHLMDVDRVGGKGRSEDSPPGDEKIGVWTLRTVS